MFGKLGQYGKSTPANDRIMCGKYSATAAMKCTGRAGAQHIVALSQVLLASSTTTRTEQENDTVLQPPHQSFDTKTCKSYSIIVSIIYCFVSDIFTV